MDAPSTTATRLRASPERRAAVAVAAEALVGDTSIAKAGEVLGMTRGHARALLRENPTAMEEAKQLIARKLMILGEAAAEQSADKLDEETAKNSAIIMGIAVENSLKLMGQHPGTQINVQVVLQQMRELADIEKELQSREILINESGNGS